jgi:hypothetical protein
MPRKLIGIRIRIFLQRKLANKIHQTRRNCTFVLRGPATEMVPRASS